MKIKVIALILIVLLCLTSCSNHNTVVDNKPEGGTIFMSAEILKSKVNSTEYFAIQLGIGNPAYYLPHATVKVTAPSSDLIIIAPDGSLHENEYTCEYTDFNSKKYSPYSIKLFTACRYYETYLFKFKETPEDHTGKITFSVRAKIDETLATPGISGFYSNTVNVYYRVRNGKIRVSTRYKDYRNWTYFDRWKEAYS